MRLMDSLIKRRRQPERSGTNPDGILRSLLINPGVIMTNTAKYQLRVEVTLPNRSVMWQILMMVTPDYQICRLRLIQAQIRPSDSLKCCLPFCVKTYGWNKPMDRITDSQLSEITKLPVKRCNEAKLELVRMNIIKQQGGMFGPNKTFRNGVSLKRGKIPKRGIKHPQIGDCYPSKTGDTKDTITKKRKDYSSENSWRIL